MERCLVDTSRNFGHARVFHTFSSHGIARSFELVPMNKFCLLSLKHTTKVRAPLYLWELAQLSIALAAPHASQMLQDHSDDLHLAYKKNKKKSIYTLAKKILYAKLIYCDHPNKIVKHLNLRITKIWI